MWWRMYSGHNCTNYVAYRLVKRRHVRRAPWSGTGMAYNWGRANSDITDQKPMVGAVAWWKQQRAGAGSSGHVAYVEKVLSPTKIVISEDSWSGDFHWRTITKSGGSWPTGFIHFDDRAVAAPDAARRQRPRPRSGKPPDRDRRPVVGRPRRTRSSGSPTARRSPAPPRPASRPRSRCSQGAPAVGARDGQPRGYVDGRVHSPSRPPGSARARMARTSARRRSPAPPRVDEVLTVRAGRLVAAPGLDVDPLVRRRQAHHRRHAAPACSSART